MVPVGGGKGTISLNSSTGNARPQRILRDRIYEEILLVKYTYIYKYEIWIDVDKII